MNKMNLFKGICNSFVVICGITLATSIEISHKKSLKERYETNTTNWTNVRDGLLVESVVGLIIIPTTIKSARDAIHCFRHLK